MHIYIYILLSILIRYSVTYVYHLEIIQSYLFCLQRWSSVGGLLGSRRGAAHSADDLHSSDLCRGQVLSRLSRIFAIWNNME